MKTLYTTIEPIPSHIPRQLAIELLQSHGELITLNPLVLEYHPIKAPRDAPADEYYSTWYEIFQKIQFVPGIGKMGSGKLSFRGCFHDMPWGVQTHMYVPFGVDLRHKYQIKGNQPGEPPEPKELGSNAPAEGLYLRVDTQIKCNMTVLSFVKKELKAASKTMLDRMLKKAELIDAGVLQAMFDDNGKLQTSNPNDRSRPGDPVSPSPFSPSVYGPNGVNLRSSASSAHSSNRMSAYSNNRQSYYSQQPQQQQPPQYGTNSVSVELPADASYNQPYQHLQPGDRYSQTYSELGGSSPHPPNGRWSGGQSEQYSSNAGSVHSYPTGMSATDGARSPRMDGYNQPSKNFAVELPSNEAVPPRPPKEELGQNKENAPVSQQGYNYNPQDFVRR